MSPWDFFELLFLQTSLGEKDDSTEGFGCDIRVDCLHST